MDSNQPHSKLHSIITKRGFLVFLILVLTLAGRSFAGVMVAPTVVVLNEKDRTGRITIQNPSERPKEISIAINFGLPISDSTGNIQIQLQDTGVTDPRSAISWVKAFPERFVLSPSASQVVRFRANPPPGLADGEYWARIVVRSQEGEVSIPSPSDSGKITTKLNMIMQTVIMLKYRTGTLISKLEVLKTDAKLVDSMVQTTIDMANRGNVSYVGTLKCQLVSADGAVISSDKIDLAVYRELTRRIKLPVREQDSRKPYKIEISINTSGRTDIAPEDIIKGNSIEYSTLIN